MTRPDLPCDVCAAEIRVDQVAVSLGDQGWAHEGCVPVSAEGEVGA